MGYLATSAGNWLRATINEFRRTGAGHITECGTSLINLEQVRVNVVVGLQEHGEVREHFLAADSTGRGVRGGRVKWTRSGAVFKAAVEHCVRDDRFAGAVSEWPEVAWTLCIAAIGAKVVVVGEATGPADRDAKWKERRLGAEALLSETLVHTVTAVSSHKVVCFHAGLKVGMVGIVTILCWQSQATTNTVKDGDGAVGALLECCTAGGLLVVMIFQLGAHGN